MTPVRAVGKRGPRGPAPHPVLLVLLAVVSVQFGAALAVTLLSEVGVLGSVTLRLVLAAGVLWAFARPRLRGRSRSDWAVVCLFALALLSMNLAYYGSLARLPVGVATTVEFLGPLALAAALSRRVRDLAVVGLALLGIVLISEALTAPRGDLDLPGLALAGLDVLLMPLELPLDVVSGAVHRGHERGARVILNLAPFAELPADVLALCDPVVVNEHEAELLAKAGLEVPELLTTRGAKGAGWGKVHVPAIPVTPVDTTGAGDAFCGTLAAALCQGKDHEAAMTLAAEAASANVLHHGAQPRTLPA